MATLLDVINIVIAENGIAGGVAIDSFEDVEDEIDRLISSAIQADIEIQQAWNDWDFMWATASVTVTAAADDIPLPTVTVDSLSGTSLSTTTFTNSYPYRRIDLGSMVARPGTATPAPIAYMPWRRFEALFELGVKTAADTPAYWTAAPDRSLILSELAPAGGLALRYRYYMMPRQIPRHIDAVPRTPAVALSPDMDDDTSVPRALVELTTMKWARAEGRMDALQASAAAYAAQMQMLRAMYGGGQDGHLAMDSGPLEIRVE